MRRYYIIVYMLLIPSFFGISEGCRKNNYAEKNHEFSEAISLYLKKESYDVKIKELEIQSIDNDRAHVRCKLVESDDSYGLSVTWDFDLKYENEIWKASKHKEK